MDVVRRHIEKLRGRIEIRSAPGEGATFLLKLPLTLAIIDGLVVGVGEERYIVPLFAVREMFRPNAETIWTVQQRAEMALVRGSAAAGGAALPALRCAAADRGSAGGGAGGGRSRGAAFCVLVDELIGKQEVVIKTLGETFKNVPGVAGRRDSGRRPGGADSGPGPDLQGKGLVTRTLMQRKPDSVRPLAPREFEQIRQLAYRTSDWI